MISPQKELLKLVTQELARIRTRNPSYSLRAYAKRLGLSVSSLSEVFNGKHRLTKRMAEKILSRIPVERERSEALLQGLNSKLSKNRSRGKSRKTPGIVTSELRYQQLDMDQYHLISDWYYFGILSLAETEGFQDDPTWISQRLGISMTDTQRALERLERLELLVRNSAGKLSWSGKQFKTSDGVFNPAIRQAHAQEMDLARASIEKDVHEICNFSSITMAIDPDKLPAAAKMIGEFRKKLCAFLEADRKKEVYKLCVQLFPLTQFSPPHIVRKETK